MLTVLFADNRANFIKKLNSLLKTFLVIAFLKGKLKIELFKILCNCCSNDNTLAKATFSRYPLTPANIDIISLSKDNGAYLNCFNNSVNDFPFFNKSCVDLSRLSPNCSKPSISLN